MSFRTWSASDGRRSTARSAVVAGAALAVVVALATAALAWLPPGSGSPPQGDTPPIADHTEDATTAADRGDPDPIDLVWRCPIETRAEFRDDYGYRKPNGRIHRGVDLYAPLGTPVVAPRPGRVERSEGGMAGKEVTLHTEGERYVFAHLSRFGDDGEVEGGEEIGYVGTTGNARGATAHLHFEIRDEDGPTDPFPLLDEHCR